MLNIIKALNESQLLCNREKIIVEILTIYNCRISEVLSANWKNFFPDRFLVLKGKKKSDDIIIHDRIILSKIKNLHPLDPELIFYPTTYKRMHRLVKLQFGHLFASLKEGKNNKVTHAFRYLNARLLEDPESIRTLLHHKSKKSQNYYISKYQKTKRLLEKK